MTFTKNGFMATKYWYRCFEEEWRVKVIICLSTPNYVCVLLSYLWEPAFVASETRRLTIRPFIIKSNFLFQKPKQIIPNNRANGQEKHKASQNH